MKYNWIELQCTPNGVKVMVLHPLLARVLAEDTGMGSGGWAKNKHRGAVCSLR